MRKPHAAKVLIRQVLSARPKARIDAHGEPDGLGVVRALRFDKRTSAWLAPLLEELGDPRFTSVNVSGAGYLHVTFVSDRHADDRTPFALDDAETVLRERADAEVPPAPQES